MLIDSYVTEICKRIKGKNVLDIGCCATTSQNLFKRHLNYKKASKRIIGVDYNKDLIQEALIRFDTVVYYCDFTNKIEVKTLVKKHGKFDTVVCTDVIEHVGNLTNFLDNINFVMTDNAILHLTTPNMRSPRWMNMFIKNKIKINPDHICWFDTFTLKNLLSRSNMEIVETMYHHQEINAIKALKLPLETWMARRLYLTIKKKL